jgi:hypothetical protein
MSGIFDSVPGAVDPGAMQHVDFPRRARMGTGMSGGAC